MIKNAADLLENADLANSAVLTIDIQNDFCHDDGSVRKAGFDVTVFQKMALRVDEFLAQVRQVGVPVIHVGQVYTPWMMSPVYLRRLNTYYNVDTDNTLRPGSWGAEFYKIKPQDGECTVMKYRDSGFFGTYLDQTLRCSKINTIILTGMATSGCVEATARDGFFRDYYVVTLEDCTADGFRKVHENAIRRLSIIGVVTSSQVVMEAWAEIGESTR